MFCSKCGTKAIEGATFCQECGVPLEIDDRKESNTQPNNDGITQNQSKASIDTDKSSIDLVDVTLTSSGTEKVKLIKILRDWTGLDLREVKELVESTPVLLKKEVTQEEARSIKAALIKTGAVLTFTNQEGNPVDIVVPYENSEIKMETKNSEIFESFEAFKEKFSKIISLIITVASILFVAVIVLETASPGSVQKILVPGIEVRSAYLSQYNDSITIEDAFDNYFDNGKWSTYKENGYSYVVFIGNGEYLGSRADIRLTFKLTGENFRVDSLDINGVTQEDLILYALLANVYEEY